MNGGLTPIPIVPEISINQDPVNQLIVPPINESITPTKLNPPPLVTVSTLVDPKEVAHNIYILAHQLSRHSEELAQMLDPDNIKEQTSTKTALEFYRTHTAQIEVIIYLES